MIFKVATGLAVVATVGALWSLGRKPERLDGAAKTAYQCVMTADGACLMRYIWNEEIKVNRLDPDKLSMLVKTVVRPALEKYGPVPRTPQYLVQETAQGVAMTDLITKSGHVVSFSVMSMRVDGQPKVSVSDLVRSAWVLDYMADTGKAFGPETLAASFAEGYRRDKPFLDSIGFRAFVRADEETGTVKIRPLDDMMARADKYLLEASASPPAQ
jgi:hypothetical protein